ncbi:terpenoid cyclases/Protein prenyltransferase [Pluteus cervinus]|uniref:Terpenoid cyclases/Protein prenyltransferase n=1 Tax=Pluteus cervinus TaxID=181527 RepID=A0ACD3A4M6_9AGAR|nr:terpenoid cyclases/Protein prenyltransferase [Pluteus cervinus]
MTLPRATPVDGFPTHTSRVQAETEEILFKHHPDPLSNNNATPGSSSLGAASTPTSSSSSTQGKPADSDGGPALQKQLHMSFLVRNMVQGFPARYISQDASQPWLMFWTLQAFSILQVGLDPGNKQRAIDTVMSWQHPDGGFGGGPGQRPHLLPTYASVCALAVVGRPGPGGGWDQIDRQKLYRFFMSVKQPDGSFLVAKDAEVDVRGTYCLLVVATLLGILTPELIEGTPEFIASCQTYEGGFASASQPSYSPGPNPTLLEFPRPPLGEAHGGYTFCALASWVLLQPFLEAGYKGAHSSKPPTIDLNNTLRWLVQMQGTEIELGGFKGRTNKLVDGCYSWWVGGAFALLEVFGIGASSEEIGSQNQPSKDEKLDDGWDDVDDSLLNRKALQEYILWAGQHPAGGLRDKPPKHADAYHTQYCLAGLSAAQHHVYPSVSREQALAQAWVETEPFEPDLGHPGLSQEQRKTIFAKALCWKEEEGASKCVGGAKNRVNASHPVFDLTITHSQGIMAHFYGQDLERLRGPAAKPTAA